MNRLKLGTGVCVIGLLLLGLALAGGFFQPGGDHYTAQVARADGAAEHVPQDFIHQLENAFAGAADIIRPSVVSITSTKRGRVGRARTPRRHRDFFGPDPFEFFEFHQPRSGTQQGLGSGVIVDERGYILTNNHVVEGANDLRVVLSDDRKFKAELVGTDPKTDLAVIKIDAPDLRPAQLADSDTELRVGQWVLAVGSPFGLKQTVTAGIVSATSRQDMRVTDYDDFIQTDAAINAGNSGGPLIDLRGHVIGINTFIISRSGGNQGVGLAVPVTMARRVMDSLIETGQVTRGWLGIGIQTLTPDLAASYNYEGTDGVLVRQVLDDGPAVNSGLASGDIIVRLNGQIVIDMSSFRTRIADTRPGTKVDLDVWRDGQERSLTIQIGHMPDSDGASGFNAEPEQRLGMSLSDPRDHVLRRLRLPDDAEGAVVVGVEPASAAGRAGLRRGDVITHVKSRRVRGAAEAQQELSRHDLTNGVRLKVRSGDMQRFVLLKTDGE